MVLVLSRFLAQNRRILTAHRHSASVGRFVNWMASLATEEICDANASLLAKGDLRILQPIFQAYGQCRAFSGPIATLKVFEDNILVREVLESPGDGRVLVIDGGGSMRCALVGGNIGQLAQNMGWAGLLVNGRIRDVDESRSMLATLGSEPWDLTH